MKTDRFRLKNLLAAWPLWLGLGFLMVTMGYPVAILLLQSVWPEIMAGSLRGFLSAYGQIGQTPGLGEMLRNSLLWGLCTVLGAWALGLPCGWLLARTDLPGKKWARILLLVPIMSPAYINALAYILTMQPGGFGDQITGGLPEGLRSLFFGFWGVTFVMVMASFGGVALAIEAALRSLPTRMEDAAACLGARPWRIVLLIILPLLMPALMNSGILVFLDAISNFGVPAILGPRANLPLLPAEIYHLATSWPIDLPLATALSALLCLASISLITLGKMILSCQAQGRSRVSAIALTPLGRAGVAMAWGWIVLLFFFSAALPNGVVLVTSVVENWSGETLRFTGGHYAALLVPASGSRQAMLTSLGLSFLTATVCVLIGGISAYGMARHPGRLASLLDSLSLMPRVIPRIVTAIAFIMAWNAPWILLEIYNTIWILALAYLALYQSDALRFADTGMRQIGVNMEHAASVFGAGKWQILRHIVLPMLGPGLFAAWITTFVVCMRDWVASIILLPPGVQTIGSFIFNQFDQGNISAAMAMAACTVVVSTVVLVVMQARRR